MNDVRNADAARLRNALKARRYVDAIAKDVVAINDDVAHIDADAELDVLAGRQIGISFRHRALNVDGATNRIDRTGELYQRAIARSLDDAAAILRDLWVDEGFAQGFECSVGALFIAAHQATVAYDVGREDCGKPSFSVRFGHRISRTDRDCGPSLWSGVGSVYRGKNGLSQCVN
jgi:hypothetical protein